MGLSSAVYLVDKGHQPVLFEANEICGGLARGFKDNEWRWSLENFYHHIFTNDQEIINFSKKVGCALNIKHPITSSFFRSEEIVLDSPLSLLKFSGISFWSRLRMGVGLGLLKLIPNGLFLEKFRAVDVLPKLLGKEGYRDIWDKLLKTKFGPFVNEVNLAWFWGRVAKRTKNLGYFEGGFTRLIDKTEEYIKNHGGEIRMGVEVKRIEKDGSGMLVDGERFDAVIITTPAPIANRILDVRDGGPVGVTELNYLWGQTLILEVSKKLIKGYWMNVLEKDFPFLVVVEHTNMIDKKNYGKNRLIYLGNYLPEGHKQLKMTKEQLIKLYLPFVKKINKHFNKKQIKRSHLFREPFAQPVFPVNYSRMIPYPRLGLGVYLANMSMVYPFDRGTNYAVKMGTDVAKMVINDLSKQ
ncbi:MAG: hypothetical protein UW16_C0002G0002 [Microgenomates group bacterium GW2011_GWC1_44_10]|nr:MAG: hypothetical protein UW16_C0002G0002 [Microgenomates group bacterium GW2011_GWC1_44_10]